MSIQQLANDTLREIFGLIGQSGPLGGKERAKLRLVCQHWATLLANEYRPLDERADYRSNDYKEIKYINYRPTDHLWHIWPAMDNLQVLEMNSGKYQGPICRPTSSIWSDYDRPDYSNRKLALNGPQLAKVTHLITNDTLSTENIDLFKSLKTISLICTHCGPYWCKYVKYLAKLPIWKPSIKIEVIRPCWHIQSQSAHN
jgi:hypothetical protein